jgi:hypothetical protein
MPGFQERVRTNKEHEMSLIPEIDGNSESIVHFRKKGFVWQKKHGPNVPKVGEVG